MTRGLALLVSLLTAPTVIYCEPQARPQLYLISGYPEYRVSALRSTGMTPVLMELSCFGYLSPVTVDYELRLLMISTSSPPSACVVSMDKPADAHAIEFNVGDNGPGFHLARTHGRVDPVLVVYLIGDMRKLEESLLGFDTKTDRPIALTWDIYKDLEITGGTLGNESGTDWLYLRQFEGGQLVIRIAQRIFEIGPILPQDLRFNSKDPDVRPKLFLNNSHYMLVANGKSVIDGKSLTYRILDKQTNQWYKFVVPGNSSFLVRGFGSWVGGLVTDSLPPGQFRLSPGRHALTPGRHYGEGLEAFDEYLARFSLYQPGTLFLYDLNTKRYYQWDNGDGDSEILLVENGEVFYRVDRSIFRAKIGDKEIGKPELLIKDDDVPYVHWAFFGPALPAAPKSR